MKPIFWGGFLVAFVLLLVVRLGDNQAKALVASSSEAVTQNFDPRQPLLVPAVTVIRARTDTRGNHVLKLQMQDGAQISLVIPPTVDVQRPSAGSTIEFTGSQLGKGALTLARHEDLKILTPGYARSQGVKRVQIAATVRLTEQTRRGGFQAVLYDENAQWIAVASILPDCADKAKQGWAVLYGYYNPERVFIVEDIR